MFIRKAALSVLMLLGLGLTPLSQAASAEARAAATARNPKSRIVYGTRTGHRYHRAGCRYLRQSAIRMTLAQAEARGWTACRVCGG